MKKFGASVNYLALSTITDVFLAVGKDADYGVVPIENSTEGAVFHSLDMLVESDLKIVAQLYLEISQNLISTPTPQVLVPFGRSGCDTRFRISRSRNSRRRSRWSLK